jgi:AraC family transcriptional regulator of arabinose operon
MRHPLLKGLCVTDAGYFSRARGHRIERHDGCTTHLAIACLRGHGWVRGVGGKRTVAAGDLVWLRANIAHAYGADVVDPWTIAWVHFTGDEAEGWRQHLGLGEEDPAIIHHASPEGIAALKLEEIHLEFERGCSVRELISTSIMLRGAFSLVAESARNAGASRSAAERIATVKEHLRETFTQQHQLEELATLAGLSVPHFCLLFRRETGFTPIDFVIRQRIQCACKLLETTQGSIAMIATAVGYHDAYYFTRCFRRIVGCPPRTFRHLTRQMAEASSPSL